LKKRRACSKHKTLKIISGGDSRLNLNTDVFPVFKHLDESYEKIRGALSQLLDKCMLIG
jgi:hypothetical protein